MQIPARIGSCSHSRLGRRSRCLTVAERDISIARGRNLQAAALPNPTLSLEVGNAFGSGSCQGLDLAEQTLQVSQLVELGGKREARIAAASPGMGVAR